MLTNVVENIENKIIDEISSIITMNESEIKTILPGSQLSDDLGLSSLDYAQLIAALEIRFEADPFAEQTPITSIRTVRDLTEVYARFLLAESENDGVIFNDSDTSDNMLIQAQKRAALRHGLKGE